MRSPIGVPWPTCVRRSLSSAESIASSSQCRQIGGIVARAGQGAPQSGGPMRVRRLPALPGCEGDFSVFCCFLSHPACFSRESGPSLQRSGCALHRRSVQTATPKQRECNDLQQGLPWGAGAGVNGRQEQGTQGRFVGATGRCHTPHAVRRGHAPLIHPHPNLPPSRGKGPDTLDIQGRNQTPWTFREGIRHPGHSGKESDTLDIRGGIKTPWTFPHRGGRDQDPHPSSRMCARTQTRYLFGVSLSSS